MNKHINIGLPIGTASVLLIFLTLSLTSFAVLSLQTSVADNNLTSKSAEYTQNYYAAVHKAQGFLADMDGLLSDAYLLSKDEDEYFKIAKDTYFSDNFDIDDMQYLHVEITVVYPSIDEINDHKKNSAYTSEISYNPSCYYYVSSFKVITNEELLEYSDAEVPVY